jgi:hypothetical protein
MADARYRAWMRRLQFFLALQAPRQSKPAPNRCG